MRINRFNTLKLSVTAALIVFATIVIAGCSRNNQASASPSVQSAAVRDDLPTASMVQNLDSRGALALANSWGTSEKGVTSFVDTKKISFEFANGEKTSVALPDAKMVVAIAPYINKTHTCEVHYMSGCQGELVNVPVKVFGKTADGLVVVDTEITTLENGFFELWLARDLEINLTVEYGGRRAVQTITTNKQSNTCITTMKLL